MAKGGRGQTKAGSLPAGRYRVDLRMLDPDSTAPGQRVFDVTVESQGDAGTCAFEPVKAKYLRLACRGNSQNAWNSIHEVRIPSLAKDEAVARATASGAVERYEAAKAVDGDPATRWAAEGRDHWIQFRLDPSIATDRIDIVWYQAGKREARFDILVSDDGRNWSKVKRVVGATRRDARDRIDIYGETGGRNRILRRNYSVELAGDGLVKVLLEPVRGEARLCGVVLKPIGDDKGAKRDAP
jgi:hypothetical protein